MSSRKKSSRGIEAPPPDPVADDVLTEEPPLAAEPAEDREEPREPALEEFARTKGRRKKKTSGEP